MRKQESAARGAHEREYETGAVRPNTRTLYSAFKHRERDDKQNKKSMLQNFGYLKTLPETSRTKRPVLRVRAKK